MRINHLVFPPNSGPQQNPLSSGKGSAPEADLSLKFPAKANARPVRALTPEVQKPPPEVKASPEPQPSGVRYTPADPEEKKAIEALDAKGLSIEKQLELGKKMGLFTKITISKEGVLSVKPERGQTEGTPEFVSAAVTTLKDYADGLALMNQKPGKEEKAKEPQGLAYGLGLTNSLPQGLQKLAARFSLFT